MLNAVQEKERIYKANKALVHRHILSHAAYILWGHACMHASFYTWDGAVLGRANLLLFESSVLNLICPSSNKWIDILWTNQWSLNLFDFILSLIILQVNHTVAEKLEHEFNRILLLNQLHPERKLCDRDYHTYCY